MTAICLQIYDFCVYNLGCRCPNIVHSADPRHLVVCLEMLRYALSLGHLLYQPGEHGLGLLVNIRQVAVQLATQPYLAMGLWTVPRIHYSRSRFTYKDARQRTFKRS